MQEWLPIPGYETTHQVNRQGQVRSLNHRRLRLKLSRNLDGYRFVTLRANGIGKRWCVHDLVMVAFRGPCPEGMRVLHKNGVKTDNRLDNLDFGPAEELTPAQPLIRHRRTLTELEILEIRWTHSQGKAKQTDLARRYGVSVDVIGGIVHHRKRKD